MQIKTAIVTGGCGFIGSHLVDKLVSMNIETTVIDNLSATSNERFYYNDFAKYHNIDVCDHESLEPIFERNIDIVFHLAAESRIGPTIINPSKAVKTNILGTQNILELSKKYNIKKIVYSSTSAYYGLKNTPPLSEDMERDCLNPYTLTKIAGEDLCVLYNNFYELPTISLRYFNVYGDRSPTSGPYAPVLGLFIDAFNNKKPMTIVGDGSQSRDFIHVNDIVEANIFAAITENKKTFGQIFNVGSGKNYSIISIAKMIGGDYNFIDPRPGEAKDTLSNNEKIYNLLGWKPSKDIIDYIKEKINVN